MTSHTRRRIFQSSLLITVLYFTVFGYLYVRPFDEWALSAFLDSTIAVFMGAGTIAIITAIILAVQAGIEGDRHKQQKVFDEKLSLYNEIIAQMKEIFRLQDDESAAQVDEDERRDLLFTEMKVALLSRPETFVSFKKLVSEMRDEDGLLSENATSLLMDFVCSARDDLDVQEEVTSEHRQQFDEAIQLTKQEAQDVVRSGRATYFVGDSPIEQYISQFKDRGVGPETQDLLRLVADGLAKRYASLDGVALDVTKTGGLSCFAGGKKRNGKFCYTRFRSRPGSENWSVEFLMLKSPRNDYQVPKSHSFESHQSFWGFEFFTIYLDRKDQVSEEFWDLVAESYRTRVADEVTPIRKSRSELKELALSEMG